MGYTKKYPNFKFLGGQEVLPLDSQNIQRKFWKIQRKNKETGYFSVWPWTQFCKISKMVGCIPEVLALLLTPKLKYMCMSNARYHICQIWHIWYYDIYEMYGKLTYTICMYVNIGVKRSIMTSGMQPNATNCFYD